MKDDEYTPRFSFEITPEQKLRADKVLDQYGIRKAIFGHILDDVLDMIEKLGPLCLGPLMTGDIKPREAIKTLYRAQEAAKDGQS
jgi:hypothetical protein